MAFYVASTGRIMARPYNGTQLSDGVVTLSGPTRYVHSTGGLFGRDYEDASWVGGVTYAISDEQAAVYDGSFGAPFCASYGSECSSMDALNGRGLMEGGAEANRPNTIDGCVDGSYGLYYEDESIEGVVVKAGDTDGSGSGVDLEAGKPATIVATVYAYSDGSEDYLDFYYASNANYPQWVLIGTVQPSQGGFQELMMDYTLPDGDVQAVRVNFRHMGSESNCTEGGLNERDDLIFTVVASTEPSSLPSFEPSYQPSESPTQSPTKSPSTGPTLSPSHSPSTAPSQSPSLSPTEVRQTAEQ